MKEILRTSFGLPYGIVVNQYKSAIEGYKFTIRLPRGYTGDFEVLNKDLAGGKEGGTAEDGTVIEVEEIHIVTREILKASNKIFYEPIPADMIGYKDSN